MRNPKPRRQLHPRRPGQLGPGPGPGARTGGERGNGGGHRGAAGFQPIDLAGDGVDAEILDDDAFFATLRDAVHDEKPLGPRDDDDLTGENMFFDQDADRGSFRDVFRRRR